MNPAISAHKLLDGLATTLKLRWEAGPPIDDCQIPMQQADNPEISQYISLFSADSSAPIQVLGPEQHQTLDELRSDEQHYILSQSFSLDSPLRLLLVCNPRGLPDYLQSIDTLPTVCRSPKPPAEVIDGLSCAVGHHTGQSELKHGLFIDVLGLGVLITGDSGSGKSKVALELISRGASLIADDATYLVALDDTRIGGLCPSVLQDFLETRELGVINIRAMYGDDSIKKFKKLDILIQLISPDKTLEIADRLTGTRGSTEIKGRTIPSVKLQLDGSLAVMIEAVVRDLLLRQQGYDPVNALSKRQALALERQDT